MSIDPNVKARLDEKEAPELDTLFDRAVLMVDEYIEKVRDCLDNGGREESASLITAGQFIGEMVYVLERLKRIKDNVPEEPLFGTKGLIEETVRAVFNEQEERKKSAVYSKLAESVTDESVKKTAKTSNDSTQ